MIAAITTAVSVFIFGAFALHQAWADKGGKPVEQHAPDWQGRAIFSLAVCAFLSFVLSSWTPKGYAWALLGFGLLAYGVFTPVFRFRLNRLRKMSPWYVSPTSLYDWQFMLLERGHFFGNRVTDVSIHDQKYRLGSLYHYQIHRAGRIAYAVEIAAAAIGFWIINF